MAQAGVASSKSSPKATRRSAPALANALVIAAWQGIQLCKVYVVMMVGVSAVVLHQASLLDAL
jgi:hypothetical protein